MNSQGPEAVAIAFGPPENPTFALRQELAGTDAKSKAQLGNRYEQEDIITSVRSRLQRTKLLADARTLEPADSGTSLQRLRHPIAGITVRNSARQED